MLNLFNLFSGGGRVAARLNPTKRVKLHGIVFTIRKLNPLDYFSGAKALHKIYDTYQKSGNGPPLGYEPKDVEKIKAHYRDTLMAGVVSMRCLGKELEPTRLQLDALKPEDRKTKIPVDHFMTDWSLAEELYLSIVVFTYGKKKLQAILSQNRSS